VRTSAEALANAAQHYTFISTLSVYSDTSIIGINEGHPIGTLADPTVEESTGETYGPLKALCEQAAETAMAGRVLTIRPGLIVGPHDPSDRFTYWPWRVAQGGEVLAPERPEYRVQFIDVRDLAAWTLSMIEAGAIGVYNATGPEQPLGMGDLLEACRTTDDTRFTWAGADFLEQQGVAPWSELPLWVPDTPDTAGFSAFDCSKALAAGLRFRPLHETVRDTLNWAATRPADYVWRAGLSREREAAILAARTES
jgi:2'-hydroxyisoflavone reductase